jgi:hypothetical protein
VLFHGDSHMRQLRNSLVLLACGLTLHVQTFGCVQVCPGLEGLCAVADGLGELPSFLMDDPQFDLIIANFGHHWIDGERRRSVSSYRRRIDALAERMLQTNVSALSKQRVIWYESNAQPLVKDAWIQGYMDQRTNVKLRLMNAYATAVMRSLGVPIIPAFTQTVATILHNVDSAHMDLLILHQSAAQFILGHLCP